MMPPIYTYIFQKKNISSIDRMIKKIGQYVKKLVSLSKGCVGDSCAIASFASLKLYVKIRSYKIQCSGCARVDLYQSATPSEQAEVQVEFLDLFRGSCQSIYKNSGCFSNLEESLFSTSGIICSCTSLWKVGEACIQLEICWTTALCIYPSP